MTEDILLEYTQKAGLQTGVLSAYYDLSGSVDGANGYYKHFERSDAMSSYVIYNQLYPSGAQLSDTGVGYPVLSTDKYPAITTSISTSVTGSGYFEGDTTLKVASNITGGAWTCFLDFSGGFNIDNPHLSQVLLSTMSGIDSVSGFNVGINGSNRLYYEYINGTEGNNKHRYSETLQSHLKKLNLVSVSKTPSVLEISLHKPNESTLSIKTPLEDNFLESEDLFLGGLAHGGAYGHFYTGLSGYINTVALFNDYVSETSRNVIAEAFFLESFTDAGLTTAERTTKEVTGVQISSVADGHGVTGYELKISHYHKNEAGESIPVHYSSGITGIKYKTVLVDMTGSANITSTTGFYTDEIATRNSVYVADANSVPGEIKFVESLVAGELLEIYSHSQYLNTINYDTNTQYFFETIDNTDGKTFDVKGYQLKNNNFAFDSSTTQPFMQVFRNGIAQQEVSGLHSVSDIFNKKLTSVGTAGFDGDYFINDNNAGVDGSSGNEGRIKNNRYEIVLNSEEDSFGSNDRIHFDIVSGSSLTGDYAGVNVHFTGEYLDKDIYLNGRKLMSGHEYSQSSTGGKTSYLLDASEIGASNKGELLFMPQASTSFTRITGDSGGESFGVDNVFFEQIWRNGIRQIAGIDYLRSPKDSLIGTGGASYVNDSFRFLESTEKIDVTVKDRPLGRKVFSYDTRGQTNLFSTTS